MKSGDTAEGADVVDTDLQFLYTDGNEYNFMNPKTFDQLIASAQVDHGCWYAMGGTRMVARSLERVLREEGAEF